MWRVAFLLVLVFLPESGWAQEYQSKELAEAAAAYRQELLDSVPANKRQPALIPRLRRDADDDYRAKRYSRAIDDLTRAIAFGADDGLDLAAARAESGRAPRRSHAGQRLQRLSQIDRSGRARQRAVPDRRAITTATTNRRRRWPRSRRASRFDPVGRGRRAGRAAEAARCVPRHQGRRSRRNPKRRAPACASTRRSRPRAMCRMPPLCAASPAFDGIVTVRGDTLCLNGLAARRDL